MKRSLAAVLAFAIMCVPPAGNASPLSEPAFARGQAILKVIAGILNLTTLGGGSTYAL